MKLKVPHIQQRDKTTCGAAALAMVYGYYGFKDDHDDIWQRLKKERQIEEGYYIRVDEMAEDARKKGLLYLKGKVVWKIKKLATEPLRGFLDARIPVIVCQKWRDDRLQGHFRVVVGYKKGKLLVSDPELKTPYLEMDEQDFISKWEEVSSEVVGGVFLAIFKREQIKELPQLTVNQFWGPIKSFTISDIEFE